MWMFTSEAKDSTGRMLHIVGEWESVHAKLEAHITLWCVQCPSQTIHKKIGC